MICANRHVLRLRASHQRGVRQGQDHNYNNIDSLHVLASSLREYSIRIGITNEAGDWTRDGTYMYPGSLTVSADTL